MVGCDCDLHRPVEGVKTYAAVVKSRKTSSPFQRGSAGYPGRMQLPFIILWRGSSASVRSKALHTLRAVRRALRILTSWPGTARGTVSSCDHYQRDTAEASQLEQEKQDTQCVVAVWAGLAIC
jgi:hypothetical protein